MSILKSKHSGWTWDLKRTPFGDSGVGGSAPAPQPTTQTVQNTNIPEYARPYVETMLGTTQQQIYNYDSNGNVTGLKPYQPYSTNPQDYVAPFSPLQQMSQQGAAELSLPSQYGQGTGAALLGTGQALTAQSRYQNTATDPYATQAYMNPYIQASLQPQLAEIQRQYDITGTGEMSAATRAGAFGGSREALMAAENQRNKNTAMNQAIGTGYNNAFQAAQQAEQYGAGLGMQGAQAGIQGGQTLAGIGGQGLQAQEGILAAQAAAGNQQQQQQQQMINQAVQNYAMAQQYPQQQLAFMNAQLRGLPLQTTTTSGYQAAPSAVSQAAGIGTAGIAGLGLYNAMK
jgi:hypothetical protein